MIDFCGVMPHTFDWGPAAATIRSVSFANSAERVIARAGPRWGCVLRWNLLRPRDARLVDVWLAEQAGGAERTWLGPLHQPTPAGTQRGAPLIHGANQLGVTKVLRDCMPGRTFLAGDHIQVGVQVYKILADAMANDAGLMTIRHWPPTRVAHADGEMVRWHRPQCPMRLVESRYALRYGAPQRPGYAGGLEVSFMESWV